MEKKTVFIVGASSGIGYETAKELINEGHTVYNGSRTKCGIKNVINVTMDVTDDRSLKRAVKRVLEDCNEKIEVFIYCAGYSMAAPLEVTSEEDFRYLFEVNFFGFAKTLQNIIPVMRKQNYGKIIVVSSMAGLYPIAFDPFYNASKAALNILVKSLEIELAPFNINVTSIMPGGTATEFTQKRKVYPHEVVEGYWEKMTKAVATLAENEQCGMAPEKVAESIMSIVKAENPPLTEAVGLSNKAYAFVDKILPESVTSTMNKNKYRQTETRE